MDLLFLDMQLVVDELGLFGDEDAPAIADEQVGRPMLTNGSNQDEQVTHLSLPLAHIARQDGLGKGTARPRLLRDARFCTLPTEPGVRVSRHQALFYSFLAALARALSFATTSA